MKQVNGGTFAPEDWAEPEAFYTALERVGTPRAEIVERCAMKKDYDIAVIGAGCRCCCSTGFGNAGHKVVLLEARDRIGGRTYTGEAFGRQVEFGGGYSHWTQPYIWRELQRYGIGLNPPTEVDKTVYFADGKLHTGTQAEYAAIGTIINSF